MERTLEFIKKWKEPVFQALISIVLLALMFSCGMIPLKYMGIAVLIALLLLASDFSGCEKQEYCCQVCRDHTGCPHLSCVCYWRFTDSAYYE